MINDKKVIACDLDGTLTISKSALSPQMAGMISSILSHYHMAVVSGGSFSQYQKQFLSGLTASEEQLQNLYLFPTNGSACYIREGGAWKEAYKEPLIASEKEQIISALRRGIEESGVDLSNPYGEIIEDRDTQITFSGKGQDAPIEIKQKWDPDGAKRRIIVDLIKKDIPEFEIRVNSVSSIDITRKGIDKAYAIEKIKQLLKVEDEDIVFIGDALYPGGNDSAVKKTRVDFIQPSDPEETMEILSRYL